MRHWIAVQNVRGVVTAFAAAGLLAQTSTAHAADWLQFRGPRGDGTADAAELPTRWGGFYEPTWQAAIPGRGWSSPVVVGDRVWLTSSEATALAVDETARRLEEGLYKEFREQFQAHSSVTLLALEINLATGELLRRIELGEVADPPPIHATNSYASPTPVSDGRRLYCHFGPLGTYALDMVTGKILWQRRFEFDDITGPGSSPILHEGLVIFPCDGVDRQFVVALDAETGQTRWQTARPPIEAAGKHRRAFSTALAIAHAGRQQIVVPGAQWVVSYNPADGRELWRVNYGDGHATIPRPVFREGLVYICTGYMKPQLWAIRVDGEGDVTESHVAWRYEKQVPEISSPIIAGEQLYFVSSLGVLTCLDAASGLEKWQQRLGGNYGASPILAAGKLYFTSQEGVTTVVVPGDRYESVARNQLIGQALASPAVAGGAILLRTERVLYCVGKP
ncbi:MAG: PQQ-binding-like beta-propeller repeat protein [Pirellulaceae bacterium]|nr:PQQ-binding-like beta-propeller repeat protein [Pirellulaceae bacterium]